MGFLAEKIGVKILASQLCFRRVSVFDKLRQLTVPIERRPPSADRAYLMVRQPDMARCLPPTYAVTLDSISTCVNRDAGELVRPEGVVAAFDSAYTPAR